ncbi:MAG: NHL repeat-containing protein, partial [Pseudomonadota bacterium]
VVQIGQDWEQNNIYYSDFRDVEALPGGGFIVTSFGSDHVMRVDERLYLEQAYGYSSSDPTAFYFPSDIVVGEELVTVHDRRNYRVVQFNKQGEIVREIRRQASEGNNSLWLKYCFDLEVALSGEIFVLCSNNGFTSVRIGLDGEITELDGLRGTGMSLAEDGRIFVTNQWLGTLSVYNSDGEKLSDLAQNLGRPTGLVLLGDRLFVLDVQQSAVLIVGTDGQRLGRFDALPSEYGQLSQPEKIAYDSLRELFYVTDAGNDRVVIYNSSGEFQAVFGQRGFETGEFRAPDGISVDTSGVVFIVDSDNSRIQILPSLSPEDQ